MDFNIIKAYEAFETFLLNFHWYIFNFCHKNVMPIIWCFILDVSQNIIYIIFHYILFKIFFVIINVYKAEIFKNRLDQLEYESKFIIDFHSDS